MVRCEGYLEHQNLWRFIDPKPEFSWEMRGNPSWYPPELVFASSDGRLWYAEWNDMDYLGEGTAWYNPDTGEGELFTNVASFIVEDDDQRLWIVVDGILYAMQLE